MVVGGRYHWSIRNAVVEEEIVFDSKAGFQNYLFNMTLREEPYTVVSEREELGQYVVVMRKRYGEYGFLGTPDLPACDPAFIEVYRRAKKEFEDGGTS